MKRVLEIKRIDVNFMLVVAVLLLFIPAVFFDGTVGNLISGRAVDDSGLKGSVESLANYFPLTGFSGDGSNVCISAGSKSFGVLKEGGVFSVTETEACDASYDFVLVFDSADSLVALANEPSCANFFSSAGYSYAPSKYWDGDFVCGDAFVQGYCSGVNLCSTEADAPSSLSRCCLSGNAADKDIVGDAGDISSVVPQKDSGAGQDVASDADNSPGKTSEPVFIRRPSPPNGDVVGKAAASTESTSALAYIVYVIAGVFLAVTVVGTIHARKKKRLERSRMAIKIAMWTKKSMQMGYSEDQVASVLRRRNVPDKVINDAFSIASGKR
ncbi:hypothetical protein HY638_03610 [Candidatus Woesearchaeota archaeon]|nr:hypothetical protein [Candidatus Woesearchaeota archaeon]